MVKIEDNRVYRNILSEIVELLKEGELVPGDRLPAERILAERFQVSRSSVREALKVMETIGMLKIRRGGGAYVREPDFAPFLNTIAPLITRKPGYELELLELREILEVKAAGLAALKKESCFIEELAEIVELMEDAVESGDPERSGELDLKFHTALFRSSGNSVIRQTAEYVNSLLEISIKGNRRILMEREIDAANLLVQHRLIFQAVKAGAADLAERRMKEHISQVRRCYAESIGPGGTGDD